eukprot:UN06828
MFSELFQIMTRIHWQCFIAVNFCHDVIFSVFSASRVIHHSFVVLSKSD